MCKERGCRFDYPRDIITESKIVDNDIQLKRSSPVINNYNPAVMTCVRSNNDLKFIHSGKDGKAFSFYMTDYATKSSLSSHQMMPLIAACVKKVSNGDEDATNCSRMILTKCLNRINTEVEISGAHVMHYLLGNTDNKTSHNSVHINLYACMAWLKEEMRKYDDISELHEDEIGDNVPQEEEENQISFKV